MSGPRSEAPIVLVARSPRRPPARGWSWRRATRRPRSNEASGRAWPVPPCRSEVGASQGSHWSPIGPRRTPPPVHPRGTRERADLPAPRRADPYRAPSRVASAARLAQNAQRRTSCAGSPIQEFGLPGKMLAMANVRLGRGHSGVKECIEGIPLARRVLEDLLRRGFRNRVACRLETLGLLESVDVPGLELFCRQGWRRSQPRRVDRCDAVVKRGGGSPGISIAAPDECDTSPRRGPGSSSSHGPRRKLAPEGGTPPGSCRTDSSGLDSGLG